LTQRCRLAAGGAIDRSRPLAFEFDGVRYDGFGGDTLASALLANGVRIVARSFKYHRPRGIYSCGADEPNALVQLARGARTVPNVRATMQPLYDRLVACSQNRWPSLAFDVAAISGALAPLLPAGFYYKTFMWPRSPRSWLRYEHAIRAAAGMGRAPDAPDPDRYEHRHAHCDVLVVGAGAAGLAAARAAAHGGARVIVCDENAALGASLAAEPQTIDGDSAYAWATAAAADLARNPDVVLLPRTTAFGCYDDNLVTLVERVADDVASPPPYLPRERVWNVRARSVVVATGAHERPIAYAGNDRPGTMLAGAALAYVGRFAVRPGTRTVVFANNDSAYATALALERVGVDVAAIVDSRPPGDVIGELPRAARERDMAIVAASAIVQAHGRRNVEAVDVAGFDGGAKRRLDCDLVCVSGGWNPAVHLFSQARGTLRYDEALATFLPDSASADVVAVGAANGRFDLAAALVDGHAAGAAAAARAGFASRPPGAPRADRRRVGPLRALWAVPGRGKRFVDLMNDVEAGDIALAALEGYDAIEHLKRYTTLGMGPDQGKSGNVVGAALLAQSVGRSLADVGTTTFRPPYTPVTLGAIPGEAAGAHVEPTRYSALHERHAALGARFVNAGLWKRPHSYPRAGESEDDAAMREATNVRANVGVVDVSTLGKIELSGRDVAEFLNRIYVNRFDTLAVGRCRYGVMLRDDGMVLDDGTVSRLAPARWLMTTTTANAVKVMQHLESLLQIDWPDLDVYAASVTERWTAVALAGPRSRDVLAALADVDVSNAALPFLACADARLRGARGPIPARLLRITYSGELAYEIHVPATHGVDAWDALLGAGAAHGIMPYGTEAMSTLRIEKGHVVVGPEADGRTTADDLGMGRLVSAAKWCVGKPLLARPALTARGRWQLVGLTAQDGAKMPRGAKIVADPDAPLPMPMQGHVTSSCRSPHAGAWIALALLADGRARHGETLWAVSPLERAKARVKIGPPCFVDPDGERARA
jgi:sarcosine oxidase subunit alpha